MTQARKPLCLRYRAFSQVKFTNPLRLIGFYRGSAFVMDFHDDGYAIDCRFGPFLPEDVK